MEKKRQSYNYHKAIGTIGMLLISNTIATNNISAATNNIINKPPITNETKEKKTTNPIEAFGINLNAEQMRMINKKLLDLNINNRKIIIFHLAGNILLYVDHATVSLNLNNESFSMTLLFKMFEEASAILQKTENQTQ